MGRVIFSEVVHALIVHPSLLVLPERHGRRLHDWHAMRVWACSLAEAESSAPPESTTESFLRGLIVGALVTGLMWALRA